MLLEYVMMKIAVVSNEYYSDNMDQLKHTLSAENSDSEVRLFLCDESSDFYSDLTSYAPSILLTENLAGFNISTLTGGPAYNLLHAIQYHVVHNQEAISGKAVSHISKPLSLSMHFLCSDEEISKKLISLNPDIPYIDILKVQFTDISAISNILLNRSL